MLGSYRADPDGSTRATWQTTDLVTHTLSYQYVGGQCTEGHYCPEGAPKEILCRAGYVCDEPGLTDVSSDKLCPAGSYCPQGTGSVSQSIEDCP